MNSKKLPKRNKKKRITFKYVLFWVLGILGAFVVGYFIYIGCNV